VRRPAELDICTFRSSPLDHVTAETQGAHIVLLAIGIPTRYIGRGVAQILLTIPVPLSLRGYREASHANPRVPAITM
jgi:hypothetical protein